MGHIKNFTEFINENLNESDKGNLYMSLPDNIKKLIDELETKWGVKIEERHLDAELRQENQQTREDAGGVDPVAKEAIDQLLKAFSENFPKIPAKLLSDYRSHKAQVDVFGSKVTGKKNPTDTTLSKKPRTIENVQAANCLPGFSQHHTGKAFDIINESPDWWNSNPNIKQWVLQNCEKYGFEVTYKEKGILRIAEPWHLYYVGKKA